MSGRMTVTGLDSVFDQFDTLGAKANEIAEKALFAGAGVVAGAYENAVNGIATEAFHYAGPGEMRLPSPQEKAVLKAGIAKFQNSGDGPDTAVGIADGYADVAGKKVPIMLVARAINSGTSFMAKQPFARKARSEAGKSGVNAIVQKAEELLNEICKD